MINETNKQPEFPQSRSGSVMRPVSVTTSSGSTSESARVTSSTQFILNLTPEAADELNQLMAQTGDNPTQLIRKALGLYKVTKQAIREGKAVGIAETADSLESQFVGI
jgi:hypothetical protein